MADGGEDTREPDSLQGLGDLLDVFLALLLEEGLIIGARERVAAHAVTARWLQDRPAPQAGHGSAESARLLRELGPLLAPVLARSPEERARFLSVLGRLTPASDQHLEEASADRQSTDGTQSEARRRLRIWVTFAGAALLVGLVWLMAERPWAPGQKSSAPEVAMGEGGATGALRIERIAPVLTEEDTPELQTPDRWLSRVLSAAQQHDYAPTLEEVAASVMSDPEYEAAGFAEPGPPVILAGHEGRVWGAVFSADETRVLTWGDDNTARLWEAASGLQVGPPLMHQGYVGATFSNDGASVVTWSEDGTSRVWDAATGLPRGPSLQHQQSVKGAVFSADGGRILTWSSDSTARLWDAANGGQIGPSLQHDQPVAGAVFSADEARILTWSSDNTARLWDVGSGLQIRTVFLHEDAVRGAVFSKDDSRVLSWSGDKTARLWDAETGLQLAVFRHDDDVYDASFSTAEDRILTQSGFKTVTVWDVATGSAIEPTLRHEDSVSGAVFSKDGTRILSWGEDKTARLWDAATGSQLTVFRHHSGVGSAAFSKDEARILTSGGDNSAKLWDVATGLQIGASLQHEGWVHSATFSADETRILTCSDDGTARIWDGNTLLVDVRWSHESFAQRLHELSGLPLGEPLDLFSPGAAGEANWARLSLALARIESPTDAPLLSELETAAGRAFESAAPSGAPALIETLAVLAASATPPTDIDHVIDAVNADPATGGAPASAVNRALSLFGSPRLPAPDPIWNDPQPHPAASIAPEWLRWLAAVLPLAFLFWLFTKYALRKPFLTRRRPSVPPLHTDLVSDAGRRVAFDAGLFQRAGQRLLTRTPQATTTLDIRETLAATLREGGMFVTPVYASARARPEYLVLIERASASDHEAQRLRQLVERLKDLVDYDVWYFQTEPGELESEDRSRRITIDQAQTRFPEHRLIVLGTGEGFLDPVSFEPRAVAEKLRFWPRRALLTPVPLADWSREEFALAEGLSMPVGRATPEGLLSLSDLLGLEGLDSTARLNPKGDGLARPLPDIFKGGGQRFLYPSAPDEATLRRLVRELKGALDVPGFEWLAAMAVYPAIQWDLTLYLGVELARSAGGDPVQDPLYDEARLATLSQLPWLKAGRMPNWLRRALIAELSPERRDEVRGVIGRAIEAARPIDRDEEDKLRLRIGREAPKESVPPQRLFEDEVLLDFLMARNEEDFPLARLTRLNQIFERNFWEQFGVPEWLTGAGAVLFAVSAFFLAPSPEHGALVTGAYVPLLVLGVGAILVLILWSPLVSARRFLWFAERAAPIGPAMLTSLLFQSLFLIAFPVFLTAEGGWINHVFRALNPWVVLVLGSAAGLLVFRIVGESLGFSVFATPLRQSGGWRELLFKAVGITAFGVLSVYLLIDVIPFVLQGLPGFVQIGLLLSPFILLTIAGWIASRIQWQTPGRIRQSGSEVGTRRSAELGRAGLVALPVVLAVLAALHLDSAHESRSLGIRPGEMIASADGDLLMSVSTSGDVSVFTSEGIRLGDPYRIGPVPLMSAVIGGRPEAPRVAYADAAGRVFQRRPDGIVTPLIDPTDGAQLTGRGAPPRLGFGADGRLFAAVEKEGATFVVAGNLAAQLDPEYGPPVALLALEPGRAALATLDGSVHVLDVQDGAQDISVRTGAQPSDPASPARNLLKGAQPGTFRMVATDGRLWTVGYHPVPVGDLSMTPAGSLAALSLGPPARRGFAPRKPAREWPNFTEESFGFTFLPPGQLIEGSGQGVATEVNQAPGMEFPVADWPAYLQSHIYSPGGGVAGGDQCDPRNFDYPWQDMFCENRSSDGGLSDCPTSRAATTVRIRAGTPALCRQMRATPASERKLVQIVAAENGTISRIGSYSVVLDSGERRYTYMHLNMAALAIEPGDEVSQGQLLGYLSNDFGGTPTTFGLGFGIEVNVPDQGWRAVSPYMALVDAYDRKLSIIASDKGLERVRTKGEASLSDTSGQPRTSSSPVIREPDATRLASRSAQRANGPSLTIVIDPGHGGRDSGAMSADGLIEKDLTLALALELEQSLVEGSPHRVVLTRRSDEYVVMEKRVETGKLEKADLFISLHADGAASPAASGAAVYILSARGQARRADQIRAAQETTGSEPTAASARETQILNSFASTDEASDQFSALVVEEMLKTTPMLANPRRSAGFSVLMGPGAASILIETGFLTNTDDAQRLATPEGRAGVVTAIKTAIDRYAAE